MKKNLVLFTLFILPIVAYLFFASGINSFNKLPTLTPHIPDFGAWHSLDGKPVTLDKKITILGFSGLDILKNKGNYFNLNQKIYQRYHEFKDLQFVVLCPIGTENDAKYIVDELSAITDVSQWHFVFAPTEEIHAYYNQLKLVGKLDSHFGTPNVFIVDKERNLRGRKEKKDYKEGYNTFHPSELSNEMLDDFKIILYEYRAALKKNHNATRKI
ncbi:hypothetical protein [Flavobacterium sp. GT3R68]|uniref:hypothetical protein n=1 Tax=Flavobacterium sp. GT3R68 TaxID=2594437 RepID=UPI000F88334C|nr:hypothetical protein [Flavobacterium sp. GT3R68]RTY90020.1 hypothetical protein EKL32_21665 [Flavobacterium sp. GSN2]TRW93343.1 hypothetical protein FNW07_00065 [Flavobacterium sp. GT3R68]